jgi:beta-lactamase class A
MSRAPGTTPGASLGVDLLVRQWLEDVAAPPHDTRATVSVWSRGLDDPDSPAGTEPVTGVAEDAEHYAASTMKLPLVLAAYRRHEVGELDLDQQVPVHNTFCSAADGSPFSLEQSDDQDDATWALLGSTTTLRKLALQSIVRSGNLATNLLLEHVGTGAVAEVLADAGCSPHTVLPRGIEDAAARDAGLNNIVTARDLGLLLMGLATRTLGAVRTCERVEEVLSLQEHRDKIPAGLPRGTYVANKTGWVDGVAHDAALVRPAGRPAYVLVVCTTAPVPEERANALIADISRAVWLERTR